MDLGTVRSIQERSVENSRASIIVYGKVLSVQGFSAVQHSCGTAENRRGRSKVNKGDQRLNWDEP